MTKEEKQLERREKREARKFSKSRSLFRDGFNKYYSLLFVFGFFLYIFFDLDTAILNISEKIYIFIFISIFIVLLILLFIQYKNYKYDFLKNDNSKFKLNLIPILLLVVFNFIFSFAFIFTLLIPFELYLINNPESKTIIQKEVIAKCVIHEGGRGRVRRGIYYYFPLKKKTESIRASYNIKRIEEIEKNNYKQKLRIYLKKGHFDTYILQRYELLD